MTPPRPGTAGTASGSTPVRWRAAAPRPPRRRRAGPHRSPRAAAWRPIARRARQRCTTRFPDPSVCVRPPDRPRCAPVDLFEYQGKQLFARYGIPVSDGAPVTTVPEAVEVADRIGYPVVVKAQVQVGGRGKAGGIKLAGDAGEVRTHAANILGMDIRGHVVRRLWIEKASDIAEEYYASFTLDRSAKQHLGMLSAKGGVDIEAVAEEDPGAIARIHVDPVDGLDEATARKWVRAARLDPDAEEGAVELLLNLYRCYVEGDADLVEVNPMILTPEGRVHAL